ncbi:DNA ligase D [Comamonas antarctica]|uniref:DNA ligase D n=1 Tax=Comamonas antarctica TaxID=2743470 RepID=UPI0028EAE497|nr:DNA ligase D [Comamonas antarctica]
MARKPGSARAAAAATAPAAAPAVAPLARYNAKRDFAKTAEPAGTLAPGGERLQFVIQKHWASHLHYDFRLELDGVMLSWAVPKGPSFDPAVKSLALQVEDHPVSYNRFEGEIPKGQYGGGTVIIWDRGHWSPQGDARAGLAKGKLVFSLDGEKLAGFWELVRIAKPGDKRQNQWLLFKKRDAWARPRSEYDVLTALPDSVVQKPLGQAAQRAGRAASEAPPEAGARRAALPATLAPQLATLVDSVPDGHWIVESKFDGYRVLVRIEGDDIRIFTRNGNDWTDKFKPLAEAVAALGVNCAWLDGEIVVLDDAGVPNVHRLQNAIDHRTRNKDIVLFAFDLPFLGDSDLRALPLQARRGLLQQLLEGRESARLRFSPALEAPPGELLSAACKLGLEGVMVKQADAPYVSGRTETWLKLKCQLRQEFAVIGFTLRSGATRQIGSLLLGYHEDGELRAAGAVGTGWDSATSRALHALLAPLEIKRSPAVAAKAGSGRWARRKAGSEHWVKPEVVVEVAFGDWTPDQQIRHAVFRGVRTDKPAAEIVREHAKQPASAAPAPKPARKAAAPASKADPGLMKVTNAQRVIDPSTGLRKIDLMRYYESVAEWILPHLRQRPVSLVRAPEGITGELFFQKHAERSIAGVTELDAALWPEHAPLLAVNTPQALLGAAQMNVIEFHTWNSRVKSIERPDRIIFDLDPGEGVTWPALLEAAELMRVMLVELGLQSWPKTSGGKGLHVVVPITPRRDYAQIKAFAQAVAQHMARVIPAKFVAVMGPKHRVGKIFIDYLRNGHGQTAVAAFSARARPGMGVSMPVAWEQLPELSGGAPWTVATARDYLSLRKDDPWSDYWGTKQTITQGLRMLK